MRKQGTRRTAPRDDAHSLFLQATPASDGSGQIVRPSLCILVADDEIDTVRTLSAILRDEGHEVHAVLDGAGVIPLTRRLRPDAVILDIGMPKLSGYELARMLKEEHGRRCPTLIAVTAYSRVPDKLIGEAAGFDFYFGKPVEIDQLLAALPKAKRSDS
jgi:CheY-like chemotaxis protein